MTTKKERTKVVIVGGGFGGLYAAKAISKLNSDITLIDKRNFHLFQPLLYQVATGSLAPGNIASPIRSILRSRNNVTVYQDELVSIDVKEQIVKTANHKLPYNYLIIATGVRHSYFGHEDWSKFAPGIKTVEDAVEMRRKILFAFEAAENCTDPVEREAWLTFVIVGGGPTGVELAGAIAELAMSTLRGEFRRIVPQDSKILLVENGDRILQAYTPTSSESARKALEKIGVTTILNRSVIDINNDEVTLSSKNSEITKVRTKTTLWAAGVQASTSSKILEECTGAKLHRSGRVFVNSDCSVQNYANLFVIGDLAFFDAGDSNPLPGVAPVAMQQGAYLSRVIECDLQGKSRPKFAYKNKGNLAIIGRNKAVMEVGGFSACGFIPWLAWAFIHILFLVEFENKFSVFTQWAWTYFTNGRGSRLIGSEGRVEK